MRLWILNYLKGLQQRKIDAECPSSKERDTAYYDLLSNLEKSGPGGFRWDSIQASRLEKFLNHFKGDSFEGLIHERDASGDSLYESRKLNRIPYERFREPLERGYNILNNSDYKMVRGVNPQRLFVPRVEPVTPPWERLIKTGSNTAPIGSSRRSESVRSTATASARTFSTS